MEQVWYLDLARALFAFFDSAIYGLMRNIYNLIEQISHYKIFDSVDFLTDRIYIILSIFMLFKVSFSFINYLVNPDSFTDKEKGVQKVIINIIVMFVMLISCPWAFKQLWNLQDALINENVMARIVFGDESSGLKEYKFWDGCGEENKSVAATNGDYVAIVVLRSFYKPYTALEIPNAGSDFADDIKDDICHQYSHGYPGIPERYLQSDIYNAKNDDDYYIMNYSVPASTAVGVVVLLILLSFAMDVGLRVIKLSFLEIFAPIPIVSYIDPSSGKNGMFKKWIKEVGSTWVSVFIRLLALYFAVVVIKEADSLITIGDYPEASFWVELFIVIGALMFAKQLPKLIQNITGINLDGGFNINPLKKISDQALGGKAVLGLGAAGVAAGMSGAANLGHRLLDKNTWAMRNKDGKLTAKSMAGGLVRGIGKTGSSAIAGAASGGYRTFNKVSKDGKIAAGIKAGHLESMFAKQQREDLERRGSKLGGRVRADANRWVGRLNEGQRQVLEAANQDQWVNDETEAIKIDKYNATHVYIEYADYVDKINEKINADQNVKNAAAYFDQISRTSKDENVIKEAKNRLDNIKKETYEKLKRDNQAVKSYIETLNNIRNNNSEYFVDKNNNLREEFNYEKNDGSFNLGSKWSALDEVTIKSKSFEAREKELERFKNSEEYVNAHNQNSKAMADNAARSINEPQPQGWKPSPNVNAGTATGYGQNEFIDLTDNSGSGRRH